MIPNDFKPINLINEPPARMLEDTDKICMGYGLSMFDTLNNSVKKYRKLYNNLRSYQKEQFKQDKGSYVTCLNLLATDGVADSPNESNFGHFTFHEYSETNLESKVLKLFSIFNENGEFNLQ
ncbi:hypothetical protein FW774_08525 [Pedobacter sp. BS3]|nr:hypothetical protein FW774_08525 [Pedobacter sp. BS3]